MNKGSVSTRVLLATVAIALAGCGSVADEESTDGFTGSGTGTPLPSSSSAESHEAQGYQAAPFNRGFLLAEEFTNSRGTFRRLRMPDQYEGIFSPDVVSRADIDTPDDDLDEALLFTGRFAAEELATSELAFNYTVEGADEWFAKHEHIFRHPERARAGLLNTDEPNQSLALLYTDNGWDRGTPERTGRVQNMTVELVGLNSEGDQLVISHLITFDARVWGPGGVDGAFIEKTRLHATYTVEDVDGAWVIADYETVWDTRY